MIIDWSILRKSSDKVGREKRIVYGSEQVQGVQHWSVHFESAKNIENKFFFVNTRAYSQEKGRRRRKIWEPLFCGPEAREQFSDHFFILVRDPPEKIWQQRMMWVD